MLQMVHKYFVDFLSKGNESLADELFSDDAEHIDQVWDPAHPTVGPAGMRHYLHDVKTAFPDFLVEIQDIATSKTAHFKNQKSHSTAALPKFSSSSSLYNLIYWLMLSPILLMFPGDTNSLWVLFEGTATGLGEWHGHRPTHHTSSFSGVNIVKFNADRSKITQVLGT